jgi:hypothetical protein
MSANLKGEIGITTELQNSFTPPVVSKPEEFVEV